MVINWVATKAQLFLPVEDTELDELSVNFDFALSAEIMELLYTQNTAGNQAKTVNTTVQFALDEHELALAA